MNAKIVLFTIILTAMVGLLGRSSVAYAQDCGTITSTQYDQLRVRVLKGNGRLTQGWCNFYTENKTTCSSSSAAHHYKHPGVDYAASLDTAVYAPIGGIVQRVAPGSSCTFSDCSLSTLAIYNSRTGKTYVFLHLEKILVKQWDEVIAGQQIGTVGRRGANGTHVHYEVRNGKQTHAAVCLDGTVNPFFNSPFVWDFNVKGNFEGWTRSSSASWFISDDGILILDPSGIDPYIASPTLNADSKSFKYVKLRISSNALDGNGAIYFKTQASDFYSDDKKVKFYIENCPACGGTPYKDYSVYMGGNSLWSGVITGIRLDPANNGRSSSSSADSIGVQYLMLK